MVDGLRARRLVVGAVSWAVFALGWGVAARGGWRDAVVGSCVLALSALAASAVTHAWQAHNRAIYRRRGPRRGVPRPTGAWQQDRLGHSVDLGDGLASALEVVITSSAGVKTYRAAT